MSVIIRSTIGTIFIQGMSAGLLFLTSLTLARVLGQEGFGAYEYADSWIEVLLLFSMRGFDRLLIRVVAEFEQNEEWGLLSGILTYASRHVLQLALFLIPLVGIVITFAFWNQSNGFIVITTFWIALFLLPIRVMLKFNQVTLQGLRRVVFAYLPDYVIRPGLLFMGLILLVDIPQEAMVVHLAAAVGALAISAFIVRRFLPTPVTVAEPVTDDSWLRTAFPFMLISGLAMLNLRGGTVLVGMITDLDTVALYAVAVRLSGIMALSLTAVSAVVAPRIARLYTQQDMTALQKLVTYSTRGILLIALCAIVILILFGDQLLGLFGDGFNAAYIALVVLAIGQLVNASTGVTGWLLLMTGNENTLGKISLFSTVIHYVLIIILLPTLGLVGAAIGTAAGNTINNILMVIFVYKKLKINATAL